MNYILYALLQGISDSLGQFFETTYNEASTVNTCWTLLIKFSQIWNLEQKSYAQMLMHAFHHYNPHFIRDARLISAWHTSEQTLSQKGVKTFQHIRKSGISLSNLLQTQSMQKTYWHFASCFSFCRYVIQPEFKSFYFQNSTFSPSKSFLPPSCLQIEELLKTTRTILKRKTEKLEPI